MQQYLSDKVIPRIIKFINTKGVQSIKNGMVYSMPLLIVGSVFLILANFPVQAVVDFLESTGMKDIMDQAYGATFNISAMIGVIGISYTYVKLEGQEPLSGSMIALATFLLLMPSHIVTESGEVVGGIIDKSWTAGKGMIGAIIIGLIVPVIYSWFLKNNIKIKMPAGVPEGVANSFSALIPAAAIITGATVIHGNLFAGIPYDADGNDLQGDSDAAAGYDRFSGRSDVNVLCGTVFMDVRRTWLYRSRRNYVRFVNCKQSGKSGDYRQRYGAYAGKRRAYCNAAVLRSVY